MQNPLFIDAQTADLIMYCIGFIEILIIILMVRGIYRIIYRPTK
jgi:hypothetical protein